MIWSNGKRGARVLCQLAGREGATLPMPVFAEALSDGRFADGGQAYLLRPNGEPKALSEASTMEQVQATCGTSSGRRAADCELFDTARLDEMIGDETAVLLGRKIDTCMIGAQKTPA